MAGSLDRLGGQPERRQRLEHHAAAQLLEHHHGFDRPQTQAAVLRIDAQAAQAELGQLAIGCGVIATGGNDGASPFKAIALVDPFAHCVAQLLLLI